MEPDIGLFWVSQVIAQVIAKGIEFDAFKQNS